MSEFKIKIKAYDWMPENEFALVYPGLAYEVKNKQKTTRYTVKKPHGIVVMTPLYKYRELI